MSINSIKRQHKITISFDQQDDDLYYELMRQATSNMGSNLQVVSSLDARRNEPSIKQANIIGMSCEKDYSDFSSCL